MASKKMLVVAVSALAAVLLPALAVATEHVVGDDKGWVLGFDYAAWAQTKQFVVGDTLVFKYQSPAHSVVEVGGAGFNACTRPATTGVLNSGEDRVTLDKAGRRWFFCGVGQHCARGMKLKITVLETAAPAPAPAPAPATGAPTPPPPTSPAGKVHPSVGKAAAAAVTALAAAMLVL